MELLTDSVKHAESPRWHDEKLWFSDVHDHRVKTIDLAGEVRTVVATPGKRPSGLGRMPNGRWLLVTSVDRRLSWIGDGGLELACDLSALAKGVVTDMVVDGHGRAYVSDNGFDHGAGEEPRPGQVILFTEAEGARVVATGTNYSNGCAVSPDGSTFYLAESFGECVTAFDVDADGSLGNRRVLAEFGTLTDGICLDADGGIWVGLPVASEFVHLGADGEIDQRLRTPGRMATACVLGGPERMTLFACSVYSTPEDLSRGRASGVIELEQVGAPAAGWP